MISAIVLAGGSGKRFGGTIKKQYREICGRPVLSWSLLAFEKSRVDEIILVCSPEDAKYCREFVIKPYGITKVSAIVDGGEERYNSVHNGLLAIKATGNGNFVLIHDGARACIDTETINNCIDVVAGGQCCVVGVPASDTVQLVDENGVIVDTPERKKTWIAQTPQCFPLEIARESYVKAISAKDSTITDDAMVVKKYGGQKVKMVQGKRENIKLTTAFDLFIMEKVLSELNEKR